MLVILNHLLGKPAGGFVGVDVFFVLSGFVITGLLLREAESKGRVSLRDFYKRRVKRIAPAAVVVLLATVGTGSLLLSIPRAEQLRGDALWAALFGANWRFISLGTDYLHATDAVSPVQHFWSLSVEEQFYLVWPLIVIVTLLLGRARLRRALAICAAVIVVLSLLYCFWETQTRPTWAYFSTGSRAWELATGALLACLSPLTCRLPIRLQTHLAWAGLAMIATAVLMLNNGSAFPAPGALIPVIGTAAILVAGERGATGDLYPLTNPVANYLGDISYSLYIWHFPVIVFVTVLHPQLGRAYVAFSVVLIAGLAVASYHLVETPLRQGTWLPWIQDRRPRVRPSGWSRVVTSAVLVVTFVLLAGVFVTRSPMRSAATPLGVIALASDVTHRQQQRTAAVQDALTARSWPRLAPGVTELPEARAPEWIKSGCLGDDVAAVGTPYENAQRCVYGDPRGTHTLVLLGDSVAISYLPGIRLAIGKHWRIEVYTLQQCPAINIDVKLADGAAHPDCTAFRPLVLAHLKRVRPDMVILSSSADSLYRLASGATGDAAVREWTNDSVSTLSMMSRLAKRVVLLDPPPSMSLLANCYTPVSVPEDCDSGVEPGYLQMVTAQHRAVAQVRGVIYPSTLPWFCSRSGLCPVFVGSTPQTVDGRHLTAATSRELAPLIGEVINSPKSTKARLTASTGAMSSSSSHAAGKVGASGRR